MTYMKIKIQNKNHSSDIEVKNLMKFYKSCTKESFSF